MSQSIQSVKGMHDILPQDIACWHWLESTAASLFAGYGYEELRVPLVEKTALFERAIGSATDVVEKEMYTFEDRGGERLSLRPEGTAGVVRAMLQHGQLYNTPSRVWYQGPMFRRERPQRGRTRQFHQIGVEVFGFEGPDIDAELLAMTARLWRELGIEGLRLEINSLGTPEERREYREALVRYFSGYIAELDDDSRRRLETNPLRILDSKVERTRELVAGAPLITEHLGAASTEHFQRLQAYLEAMGVDYQINPHLVRGLDYYSHTVFEWITDQLGAQGTVCAGGRYDGLVELQGGKAWPGIGFAMGQERLVELIRAAGGPLSRKPHVYLVLAGEGSIRGGLALAEQLRNEVPGLRLECNMGQGSFKAQFKRADRSGAQFALVLGEDELAQGRASIRPLREADGEQLSLDASQVGAWLQQRI